MGAVAVDLNNPIEVNTVGLRALNDALGEDGARFFIGQYWGYGNRTDGKRERPRITVAQIVEVLERSIAKARELRGTGSGDFTKERHEQPEPSLEEVAAKTMRLNAMMSDLQSKHPECSVGEITAMLFRAEDEKK
jgi:hypothetical protein